MQELARDLMRFLRDRAPHVAFAAFMFDIRGDTGDTAYVSNIELDDARKMVAGFLMRDDLTVEEHHTDDA